MTQLWVLMTLMALAGALVVVIPLLKHRARKEVSGEEVNSLVYRDRLQELETDMQEGRVTQAEFDQLKNELELTLLEDVDVSRKDGGERSHGGKWLMWPVLVLIPLAGLGIYWKNGYSPIVKGWLNSQDRMAQIVPMMMAGDFKSLEQEKVQLPDLIRALQKHLQEKSDDDRGWYLLGVSYMQVRMPQEAELAFRRALNLDQKNERYLLGYTQASIMLNNGQLTPALRHALDSLIQKNPENPKPYMTLGMASFQSGNFADAIAIWQRYLNLDNPDPKAAQLLERSIAVAKREMQKESSQVASAGASGGEKPTLKVHVTVSDDVRKQISTGDTLFIYAKAVNGPPMPLAVVRQPVGSWPVEVNLSDDNAMTPMATLSKFPDVVVQARISASGNAIPQSGDWIGPNQEVKLKPGQQEVSLEIASRIP